MGVPCRDPNKLIRRMKAMLPKWSYTLKKFEAYGLNKNPALVDLISRMLKGDPKERISPQEIIDHEFCKLN